MRVAIRLVSIGRERQLITGARLLQQQKGAGAPRNGMIRASSVARKTKAADNCLAAV
jgi:hypothetical protein